VVYQLTIKQFAFFLPGCYEWFIVSNANEIIFIACAPCYRTLVHQFIIQKIFSFER